MLAVIHNCTGFATRPSLTTEQRACRKIAKSCNLETWVSSTSDKPHLGRSLSNCSELAKAHLHTQHWAPDSARIFCRCRMQLGNCTHRTSCSSTLSFLHKQKPGRGRLAVSVHASGWASLRACRCEASTAGGMQSGGRRAAAALCVGLLLQALQPNAACAMDMSSMSTGTASRSATVEVVGSMVSGNNDANTLSTNTQVRRAAAKPACITCACFRGIVRGKLRAPTDKGPQRAARQQQRFPH